MIQYKILLIKQNSLVPREGDDGYNILLFECKLELKITSMGSSLKFLLIYIA